MNTEPPAQEGMFTVISTNGQCPLFKHLSETDALSLLSAAYGEDCVPAEMDRIKSGKTRNIVLDWETIEYWTVGKVSALGGPGMGQEAPDVFPSPRTALWVAAAASIAVLALWAFFLWQHIHAPGFTGLDEPPAEQVHP